MLLTIADAAAQLTVSARTVAREIEAGALPFVMVRGAVRIDAADISAYILRKKTRRAQQCQPTSAAIGGISGYKSAASKSREVLARLVQKRTR